MVAKPRHGYGGGLNPCIDCRIMKFRKAKELMKETKSSFIVTGEVVGQRPMSQHKRAIALIEKKAGLEGMVVRPLSAKMLKPSIPEQNNWVKREDFMDFTGRTRKPQIRLAASLGINDYPCPAGGCLLTDSLFIRRVKDLFKYGIFDMSNVNLTKLGRHFRLSDKCRLILGRDEQENNRLQALRAADDIIFEPDDVPAPCGIGRGEFTESQVHLACGMLARYASKSTGRVRVKVTNPASTAIFISAEKAEDAFVNKHRI